MLIIKRGIILVLKPQNGRFVGNIPHSDKVEVCQCPLMKNSIVLCKYKWSFA